MGSTTVMVPLKPGLWYMIPSYENERKKERMRKQDKGAVTKWDLFYGILIGHKQGEAKLRGLKEGLNGPPVTEGGLLSRLQGHSIAVSGELFFFFFFVGLNCQGSGVKEREISRSGEPG